MRRGPRYLVGQEAVDIARITGLGLSTPGYKLGEAGTIHPDAVTWETLGQVFIDLTRLSWVDRMRVAFARIGAHYYLRVAACVHSSSG